jgi:transposase
MFACASAVVIAPEQRRELKVLVRAGSTPQSVARKCRVILLAGEGASHSAIARQTGISRPTILAVRSAFDRGGVAALRQRQKRKRGRPVLTAETEQKIVEATLKTRPADATHWSVRRLAAQLGLSRMMVQRVWQKHGIQPHRVEKFKISRDPRLEDKVRDVIGLYLNPPERALVLSVEEKSQIQALDRTAPILPLRPGIPERQTHDYKRHGTTTLFAALNILNGKVIGACLPRHRSREFLKFLRQLETQVPADLQIHLVVDNASTHKRAEVRRWLASQRRARLPFHFTPTSSSWLNQVERLFGIITERMIRRGTFHNVAELETAIYKWLAAWNTSPKPFTWTASADVILEKVRRCKESVGTAH